MTSPLLLASSAEDAATVDAVLAHHAQLAGGLIARVGAVLAEAAANPAPGAARSQLLSFCHTELLPHAAAEERALYPQARALEAGRLLVEGMLTEHRALTGLVEGLTASTTGIEAAALATALRALFELHLLKENELLLPLLAAEPGVSLADAVSGVHALLGEGTAEAATASGGGCGGACGCGGDPVAEPVLDVRELPHALRHAMVFGALDSVPPGQTLILVAPHDPVPLLGQLAERSPGAFAVEYVDAGPETWRLRLTRVA